MVHLRLMTKVSTRVLNCLVLALFWFDLYYNQRMERHQVFQLCLWEFR